MDDKEQRIRERAFEIWKAEGRPEGRESEHWEQARRELEESSGAGSGEPGSVGVAPVGSVEPALGAPGPAASDRNAKAAAGKKKAAQPSSGTSGGRMPSGKPGKKPTSQLARE